MTRLRLLLLMLALAAPVVAQHAPDATTSAYDRAAKLFIDGDSEQAEATAMDGLRASPNDAKLQALLDLIRQQQPPQDGGGGDQNEEDQNQPDEPQDEGGDGSEGQQNQESPPDERQEAEQDQTRTNPQDGEGEESDSPSEGAQPGEGGDTPQREAAVPEGQMSAEQAGRILDAVGGEERLLLREIRRRPTRMRRSDKDW